VELLAPTSSTLGPTTCQHTYKARSVRPQMVGSILHHQTS